MANHRVKKKLLKDRDWSIVAWLGGPLATLVVWRMANGFFPDFAYRATRSRCLGAYSSNFDRCNPLGDAAAATFGYITLASTLVAGLWFMSLLISKVDRDYRPQQVLTVRKYAGLAAIAALAGWLMMLVIAANGWL